MVWKDHQSDDVLKIVLPRSKWICSWRLNDEVFQVLQRQQVKQRGKMAYTSQGFPLGFIRQDLMFSGDTIYERIHKKDAAEGDYLQKLFKELKSVHQRSPADITEQVKCICLYDLNHDGVVDLSDFVLLVRGLDTSLEHVQELAEFGRVYGRKAEYEFWR